MKIITKNYRIMATVTSTYLFQLSFHPFMKHAIFRNSEGKSRNLTEAGDVS